MYKLDIKRLSRRWFLITVSYASALSVLSLSHGPAHCRSLTRHVGFSTIETVIVHKSLSKRRRSVFLSHTVLQHRRLNHQCWGGANAPSPLPSNVARRRFQQGLKELKKLAPGGARSVLPEFCASRSCSYIKYVCVYHSSINHFGNMSLWCRPGTKISKASGYRYKNEQHPKWMGYQRVRSKTLLL